MQMKSDDHIALVQLRLPCIWVALKAETNTLNGESRAEYQCTAQLT
jgi:hypothetical protein